MCSVFIRSIISLLVKCELPFLFCFKNFNNSQKQTSRHRTLSFYPRHQKLVIAEKCEWRPHNAILIPDNYKYQVWMNCLTRPQHWKKEKVLAPQNWRNPRGAAGQNWLQIPLIPLSIMPAIDDALKLKEERVGKSFNFSLFTYFDCLLHRNTF